LIRIHKGPPPATLLLDGAQHARELCDAYLVDPERYQNGQLKMQIRQSIYASEGVRTALETCQHGKCCYCETAIQKPFAYPHIEHWRPKSSSRQARKQKSTKPGYYWLAYRWDNLLLSCVFCNSENKGDLFPLEDPATRATHHGMPLEAETPSILKPDGDEDPRDHITFRMEEPVGLTEIGRKTIEVLRLDSPKHGLRLKHLTEIIRARELAIDLMGNDNPKLHQHAEKFRTFVERAVLPEMQYSAMAAAYLNANPLPERPVPPPE
jgi:uncharacterized protein (TIGR02646 family)